MNILDLTHDIVAELSSANGPFQETFLEKYILNAIVDLCKKTYCYTEEISDVSVVDTAEYTLTPITANAKLVGFISARWGTGDDSTELTNTNKRELDEQDKLWQTRTGQPSAVTYGGGDTIRFDRIPDTAALTGIAIELLVAITPNSVDSIVPKVIELRHLETVKYYVKWKTYESPDFFDIKKADYFRKFYKKGMNELKDEILEELIGNTTVKAKSFLY